jgi:hypothetical protein
MNVLVRLTFRHHLQKRKDRCSSSNRIKGKIVVVGMSENDDNNEEYNNYVLNDGIWAKIDAQTNAYVLDMLYTRARKKIRQHSGLLTSEEALKLVMKEDK